MDNVQKKALEVYPKMSRVTEPHGIIPADYKSHYIGDANEEKRIGFIEGYHQAKKDLTLTLEDIRIILDAENDILRECNIQKELVIKIYPREEDYYGEILKRFKEEKEKIDN